MIHQPPPATFPRSLLFSLEGYGFRGKERALASCDSDSTHACVKKNRSQWEWVSFIVDNVCWAASDECIMSLPLS